MILLCIANIYKYKLDKLINKFHHNCREGFVGQFRVQNGWPNTRTMAVRSLDFILFIHCCLPIKIFGSDKSLKIDEIMFPLNE